MSVRANALSLLLAAAAGCTGETRTSTTPRTADEQLLVSTAAERAIARIDVRPLRGRAVYIEVATLESVDRSYVIAAFRQVVALAGARLVPFADDADVIIEVRAAALATWDAHWGTTLPLLYVIGPFVPHEGPVPEWVEIGYTLHEGWGRVQAFAYERATGAYLFGWRDGWGRAYKGFTDDIYPP